MKSISLPRRALALFLTLQLACPIAPRAEGLPELGDTSESVLSEAKEREIGRTIMQQVRADPAYISDADLEDYIRALGQRLFAAYPTPRGKDRELEFFLVQDDAINAFAMVGGYIGIHSGLFLLTQSESELAGVVAHEIGHIVQRHQARGLQEQSKSTMASLAALAVAILAARGNSTSSGNVTDAALASAQALQIQGFLDYTREFEREADRVGLSLLDKSGLDTRGMATFFERLLNQSRFNDPGATRLPGYLRTHPLTTERIADMQGRIANLATATGRSSPRWVVDSVDYQLVKAKLRALQGSPNDALNYFTTAGAGVTRSRADTYGLAIALLRARKHADAEAELLRLKRTGDPHPMIELAIAELRAAQGNRAAAVAILRDAARRFSDRRALHYALAEQLIALGQPAEAMSVVQDRLVLVQDDAHLWGLLARSASATGKLILGHRAQAELYYRRGMLRQAVDQLEQAVRVREDGDFQEAAVASARLRELRGELLAVRDSRRAAGP